MGTRSKTFLTSTTAVDTQQMSNIHTGGQTKSYSITITMQKSFNLLDSSIHL